MALNEREARIARAIGQAFFPRERTFDVDAVDAGLVDYLHDYTDRLPAAQRLQVKALLRLVDTGFLARGSAHGFTEATVEERSAYLQGWEQSEIWARRLAFEALRVLVTLAYVESSPVVRAAGLDRMPEATGTAGGVA